MKSLSASVENYYRNILSIPNWKAYAENRLKQEAEGYGNAIQKLRIKQMHTVLSVGSGWGGFGIAVAELGIKSYMVEPDDERREISIDRAKMKGVKCEITNACAENLPYPNEMFDVIDCTSVLEHVQDPKKAIAEMMRVLKSGGILHLQTTNNLYPSEPHYKLPWIPFMPKPIAKYYLKLLGRNSEFIKTINYFTSATIDKYLSDYDGSIIYCEGYPYRTMNGTIRENVGHAIWNLYVKMLGKMGRRNDIIFEKSKHTEEKK